MDDIAKSEFGKLLSQFDYNLPPDRIALSPVSPRDSAKLMVYDRKGGQITDAIFRDLPKFLPKGALLVFNDTKVIPAKLTLIKPTGGTVRVLFIPLEMKPRRRSASGIDRHSLREYAYTHRRKFLTGFIDHVGRRLRTLSDRAVSEGTILYFKKKPAFRAIGREGKYLILTPLIRGNLRNFLERNGEAPLPPYIKNTPLTKVEQRRRYQTVFAKVDGSIAAPTASLHFTPKLFRKLKKSGIEITFVTLHVGLGTFAPLTPENVKNKSLHEEEYSIDTKIAGVLNRAMRAGRPIA